MTKRLGPTLGSSTGFTSADARGFFKDVILPVLEEPAAVCNGSDFNCLHKVGN